MGFHYQHNGQQFGPVTIEQLRAMVQQGQLAPHELVWAEGTPHWVSAASALGMRASAAVPSWPGAQQQPMLVVQSVAPRAAKSRVAYVLLGLFLGGLGIHNFYAGYTGRGVAQLLIAVLAGWLLVPLIVVGIWALIEVVTVTTDANGIAFA